MCEARRTKKGRLDRFAARWDRRESFRPPRGQREINVGDVGEDADGVWSLRHPEALLAEDRALGELMRVWWATSDRRLRLDEVERRSAWWVALWNAASAALSREESARMKPKKPAAAPRRGSRGEA